jgi:hypothetical protein
MGNGFPDSRPFLLKPGRPESGAKLLISNLRSLLDRPVNQVITCSYKDDGWDNPFFLFRPRLPAFCKFTRDAPAGAIIAFVVYIATE